MATTLACLGWQECGVYLLNNKLQIDTTGRPVPEAEYQVCYQPGVLGRIPVPTVTMLDDNAIKELYSALEDALPMDTYMAAVLIGGLFTDHNKMSKGTCFMASCFII